MPTMSLRHLLLEGIQRASTTNPQRKTDDESYRSLPFDQYSIGEKDAMSVRLRVHRWQPVGYSPGEV